MKVKKLENLQNKMGSKGCQWSSLTVTSTENPLSLLLCNHFSTQLLLFTDIDRLDVLPPSDLFCRRVGHYGVRTRRQNDAIIRVNQTREGIDCPR